MGSYLGQSDVECTGPHSAALTLPGGVIYASPLRGSLSQSRSRHKEAVRLAQLAHGGTHLHCSTGLSCEFGYHSACQAIEPVSEMGKHKPMSILKRTPGQQDKRKAAQPPEQGSPLKRQKPPPAKERPTSHGKPYTALHMNTPANKRVKAATERLSTGGSLRPGSWEAVSIVDRQAARAVQQLLQADASGRGGASIKSLTLAPSIEAKKATHAVTCQTLKLLPVLKQLLEGCSLLQQHPQLQPETAYVLVYEILFGEGLRRRGPAEKAVMAAKGDLKALLQDIKMQAGAIQENTTTVCCCFLGQSRGAAKCFRSSQGCVLF